MPAPRGKRPIAAHSASPIRSSVISHTVGIAGWRRGTPTPIAAAMTPTEPAARLAEVTHRINRAARSAGRDPESITLIAVSKTHPPDAVAPLISAGQRAFGENRVQEAQAKWPALRDMAAAPIELHLIGQLQSNKADEAVSTFDVIHSVDRSSLVNALARAIDKAERAPRCFIQVNIGDELQKGGVATRELGGLLNQARDARLPIIGLMCIPPADLEPAPYFALLAKLASDYGLSELSMGMSGDFETAITIGATHVRVGTALFGARA